MEEIIKLLNNLGVKDYIEQTFNANGIPFNEDNLIRVAIGFGLIKDVLPISIILNQEVSSFISKMQLKQQTYNTEQGFALIGKVQVDDNGNNTIFVDEFVENNDGLSSEISGSWGQNSFQKVVDKTIESSSNLKVLFLCHTHPNMEMVENDKYSHIRDAIENILDNPLNLREKGLNPSLGDIRQLLSLNHYFPGVMKFIGILLPNGEFNILAYNGQVLQQISNVFTKNNSIFYQFPTFMTNSSLTIDDNNVKKNS